MSTDTIRHEPGPQQGTVETGTILACSIGIMAYNEEANIARTLQAVLAQQGPAVHIQEIIVVASGCTDRTTTIVAALARVEPRIQLCVQEQREGKASAINLFLTQAHSPVLILLGADVLPARHAFEHLCAPLYDPAIGMVGGRPIPINDPQTFMGHTVHLLWHLHDCLARQRPKLGEIIAFRPIIPAITPGSAVDEISIQALISARGYIPVYQPACVVYNKGPLTVRDFLTQRRRIYAGHLTVRQQQRYEASTMPVSPIFRQLIACRHVALRSPRQVVWTLGAILLEAYARAQGRYDFWRRREHHIWQVASSTKDFGGWAPPAEVRQTAALAAPAYTPHALLALAQRLFRHLGTRWQERTVRKQGRLLAPQTLANWSRREQQPGR